MLIVKHLYFPYSVIFPQIHQVYMYTTMVIETNVPSVFVSTSQNT